MSLTMIVIGDSDGHGQCATDDEDDDVTLWPFFAFIAVSRSALGKIRRLLSCHHHLLVRFHYNFFGTLFYIFWDTFLGHFFTLFKDTLYGTLF